MLSYLIYSYSIMSQTWKLGIILFFLWMVIQVPSSSLIIKSAFTNVSFHMYIAMRHKMDLLVY